MREKKDKLFVLFALLLAILPGMALSQTCEGCKLWTEGNKLSWDNFEKTPDPNLRALAYYTLSVSYNYEKNDSGKYVIDAYCNFQCDQSWCIKERVRPYMLEHIQGNFDIGEVYARKLKQELAMYAAEGKHFKHKIKWIYNKNEEERIAFNALYDIETNHGYYFKEQELWNNKIAGLLGTLKQYASNLQPAEK